MYAWVEKSRYNVTSIKVLIDVELNKLKDARSRSLRLPVRYRSPLWLRDVHNDRTEVGGVMYIGIGGDIVYWVDACRYAPSNLGYTSSDRWEIRTRGIRESKGL